VCSKTSVPRELPDGLTLPLPLTAPRPLPVADAEDWLTKRGSDDTCDGCVANTGMPVPD
jgi:hypothetical protein